ncbi:PDZ domain-containing protein [Terracidiphilus gabretensis]|jgi:serine protease Do|uniref:PDZ domain-containing protein n=1 Tax=Terracidiphilus gabretensis TaxID=1577687 RepID=UPI00071B3425|nr:PDZ domain-containing protein [Terracidiphilus gabretensis]
MQYFSRPCHLGNPFSGSRSLAAVALIAAAVALAPSRASAQDQTLHELLDRLHMTSHAATPGYLGVLVTDVDNESFSRLRLTEKRGAVITNIDHDAPAGGQKGLRINDVVLSINGQNIESATQFNATLHEVPSGRWVSLVIMREGNQETLSVLLVDRRSMERDVWNKLNARQDSGGGSSSASSLNILSGASGGDVPSTGGFHVPFFGSELKVGAVVEPLSQQMSDYLGIPSGLLVKQVARHTEAESAGLHEYDIILRVGPEAIKTTADWDRTLKANQGKQVQLAILRDSRQQTLTLQVDNKRHK